MRDLTTEQWRRVEAVFERAVELETTRRAALVDETCGDDPAVRREVETLLSLRAGSASFMESPIVEISPRDRGWSSGSHVGPYRLRHRIGSGGMGTVWLAERSDEQFEQRVAIKLIKPGMDSEDILARFRNERQVLAGLEHPNIARLLDGGATDTGRPYLVMEHVSGVPIDRYCDERRIPTMKRLELFRKVCAAVQHAHRNLVVHRDLKPSNILVTEDGEPKLLDFGIAKVLGAANSVQTVDVTVTALRLMTPRYSSPEQIRGEAITTASDVYSLGVILYELLTGRQPYRTTTDNRRELERLICEQEPRRPSSTHRRLAGDLDTIMLMALRKEPERRYASPEQLSDDLRRHLAGLPVLARADTFAYRTAKFVRRHAVAVVAATLIALTLAASTIVSSVMYSRSERALRLARWQAYAANVWAANSALKERHDNVDARLRLDLAAAEHRRWEWEYLAGRLDRSLWQANTGGRTFAVAISPDQTHVASGAGIQIDGRLRLFDARTGALVHAIDAHDGWIWDVEFNPKGDVVASAGGDGAVRLWHVISGDPLGVLQAQRRSIGALAFSPDGEMLVAAEGSKTARSDQATVVRVWSWRSGAMVAVLEEHDAAVWDLAFSTDGALLASASMDRTVRVWDTSTWQTKAVLEGHEAIVTCVAFSADGTSIVSGARDGKAIRWDIASGQSVDTYPGQGPAAPCFAIDADGSHAISASHAAHGGENAVIVWELETGAVLARLLGHDHPGGVWDAAFSPDRLRIATGGWELGLRLWDTSGCPSMRVLEHPSVAYLAVSGDGAVLASADSTGRVRIWDPRSGLAIRTIETSGDLQGIDLGPSGRRLVTCGAAGVRLWHTDDGTEEALYGVADARVVAIDPFGRWLATGTGDGTIALRDLHGMSPSQQFQGHGTAVHALAFSRDGTRLASGSGSRARDTTLDRSIRIWEVATGREVAVMGGFSRWVTGLAYSPDGSRLYSTGADNRIRAWDVRSGREQALAHNRGGGFTIHDLAMTPDGRRLATAGAARSVRIWDAERLEPILALPGHLAGQVRAAAFDPNGAWLASAGDDDTVLLWDTTGAAERLPAEVARRTVEQSADADEALRRLREEPWLTDEQRQEAAHLVARARVRPSR